MEYRCQNLFSIFVFVFVCLRLCLFGYFRSPLSPSFFRQLALPPDSFLSLLEGQDSGLLPLPIPPALLLEIQLHSSWQGASRRPWPILPPGLENFSWPPEYDGPVVAPGRVGGE